MGPSSKKPSGGHGGGGGNVVIVADPRVGALAFQEHHFRAQAGKNGGAKNATGRSGKDMVIRVPCGTVSHQRFFFALWVCIPQDG